MLPLQGIMAASRVGVRCASPVPPQLLDKNIHIGEVGKYICWGGLIEINHSLKPRGKARDLCAGLYLFDLCA